MSRVATPPVLPDVHDADLSTRWWSRIPRLPGGGTALVMMILCLAVLGNLGSADLFMYNLFLVSALVAIAMNLLMGTGGQASIGGAAFLAVGGFGTVIVQGVGLTFPFDVLTAALVAGLVGLLVGFPALRLRGLYLILSTLAAHFIVLHFVTSYQGHEVGAIGFQLDRAFGPQTLLREQQIWVVVLTALVCLFAVMLGVLGAGRFGRAGRMIRDHEAAAPSLGMNVTRIKLAYFTLSSAMIGLAGGLNAYMVGTVEADRYTLALAISFIAMILIGGMDSIAGSIIGAAVIVSLPLVVGDLLPSLLGPDAATHGPQISQMIYGLAIVVFVLASPDGLAGLFRRKARSLTRYFRSMRQRA